MRALVALVLLILLMPAAHGQEVSDFFPFAPGNIWEYTITYEHNDEGLEITGYATIVVERDTLINGLPGAVYTKTEFDAAFVPIEVTACYGWVDGDRFILSDSFDCYPYTGGFPWAFLGTIEPGGEVTVGGQSYPVEARATRVETSTCGSGGTDCGYERRHATDLGLYYAQYLYTNAHSGSTARTWLLNYARVGSETFGAAVVGAEPPPPAQPAAFSLVASPNPSAALVRVVARGAARGPVTFEVYDASGRRLRWDAAPSADGIMLDLRTLAKGVYVVRARDRSGTEATTRVVRR